MSMRTCYVWFIASNAQSWKDQWEMDTFIFTNTRRWAQYETPLGTLYVEVQADENVVPIQVKHNSLASGFFDRSINGDCYWRVPQEWSNEVLPAINQYKSEGIPLVKQNFPKCPEPISPLDDWINKLKWLRAGRRSDYWL